MLAKAVKAAAAAAGTPRGPAVRVAWAVRMVAVLVVVVVEQQSVVPAASAARAT